MNKPFRLSNLSKDIIIRLQRLEIERLRKENEDMKEQQVQKDAYLERKLVGLLTIQWNGDKPVRKRTGI